MANSYSGFVVFYTWVSNSFPRPPSKRAVAVALVNALSQIGNIAGSWVASYSPIYTLSVNAHCWHLPLHRYVWPSAWGPTYRNSYAICIATAGCSITMCYIFRLHLAYLNRQLDREEQEKGVVEKGFRYLL